MRKNKQLKGQLDRQEDDQRGKKVSRRVFLKQSTAGGAALFSLMCGAQCWARWNFAAFEHVQADTAMQQLLDGQGALRSNAIHIDVPDNHNNHALVPVAVSTTLKNVESVSLLVDSELMPIAASFRFPSSEVDQLSTRLRMTHSSRIWAVVKTRDQFFISDNTIKLVPFRSRGID